MPKPCIDLLPPSKSAPNRVLTYHPACRGVGTLELADAKSSTRYAVCVQPYGGVRLTKADGENYTVTAASCECAGFVYGRGALCRHVLALHSLLSNGWLDLADDRETVRDIAAEAEEMDAFWGRGPDRLADDAAADVLGRRLCVELGGA